MSDAPPPAADDALDDLRRRVRATRRVPLVEGVGWDRGTDAAFLDALLPAWADRYDWREHERDLLALPWRTTADGMRVIDRAADREDAPVVVLLHGWPDSFLRFTRVLPLLPDLRVIVPCLPGFPHGRPVSRPGDTTGTTADLVAAALRELGVARATVSGGDIGSSVAESLAARHGDLVASLHLTDVPMAHLRGEQPDDLTDDERAFLERVQQWSAAEGAYSHEQSTKPHTLAVGLGDSPAGLAAWIVEKLRSWSDCGGDVEAAFPRDDLLTWVTFYWLTGAIGTSFTPYVEARETVSSPSPVPTAFTVFPFDIAPPPRSYAERFFDVRVFERRDAGGHFAAWEQPASFVAGLRQAVALG